MKKHKYGVPYEELDHDAIAAEVAEENAKDDAEFAKMKEWYESDECKKLFPNAQKAKD